jgi:hypothetical protein
MCGFTAKGRLSFGGDLGFLRAQAVRWAARRHRSAQLIAFAPGRVTGHSQEIIEGGSR